ncbi:hypothetical protein PPL_07576 [Heterostelium album PN500]|uniref:Pentatricopeptide repeat-containing protein-mitochondrial domain-containing protein n=1 Tax=Heterostelium pallidum (strain ATCC 26659 / Pp 5 / PN500) TaxID=670386 RepID=D3BGC5_HETP5|nr:hypothetical protein PPL_07576 [Heterostelium album PN500]EFA79525.1 hypothetical protein PPL_07576 [Heterostelium album PN500]|eukprot:XP_020431646.1 hypothetical protein PPL_07576 [Heterostelium album PN500]
MNRIIRNLNRSIYLISNSSKPSLSLIRNYSTSYIADDVDPNDNFDWLNKRSTKKVTSVNDILNQNKSSTIQQQQQQQQQNNIDQSEINDESLKSEIDKASTEWNQPIDRANLTLSTLVRVCGKLNTDQERHDHIVRKLESIINADNDTNNQQESSDITLDHCHQLLREFVDRTQIELAEQLFRMLTTTKDTTIERLNIKLQQEKQHHQQQTQNKKQYIEKQREDNTSNLIFKCIKANNLTYKLLMEVYSNDGLLDKCMEVFEQMIGRHMIPDAECYLIVIRGYTRANKPDDALAYFNRKIPPNVLSHPTEQLSALNEIIGCYARLGNIESLEQTLKYMTGTVGLSYDSFTFQHMIDAYVKCGDIRQAVSLLYLMDDSNVATTTYSYHRVFEALGREALVGQLFRLFELMNRPGKPMIESYLTDDFYQRGEFKVSNQWRPNIATFNVLIEACCRAQDLEKAFETLSSMQTNYQLTPSSEIYSSLEALSLKQNKMELYNKHCGDQFHIIKHID